MRCASFLCVLRPFTYPCGLPVCQDVGPTVHNHYLSKGMCFVGLMYQIKFGKCISVQILPPRL